MERASSSHEDQSKALAATQNFRKALNTVVIQNDKPKVSKVALPPMPIKEKKPKQMNASSTKLLSFFAPSANQN